MPSDQVELAPPVRKGYGIAKVLDALVVGGVSSYEFQAIPDSNRRDHGIATAYGPSDAIEVASNPPSEVGGVLVEGQYLFSGDCVSKRLNTFRGGTHLS